MKITYAVVSFAGVWRIIGERRRIGAFEHRQDAIVTAQRLCKEAWAAGCEITLFVQDDSGLLTLCEDFDCPPQTETAISPHREWSGLERRSAPR